MNTFQRDIVTVAVVVAMVTDAVICLVELDHCKAVFNPKERQLNVSSIERYATNIHVWRRSTYHMPYGEQCSTSDEQAPAAALTLTSYS